MLPSFGGFRVQGSGYRGLIGYANPIPLYKPVRSCRIMGFGSP